MDIIGRNQPFIPCSDWKGLLAPPWQEFYALSSSVCPLSRTDAGLSYISGKRFKKQDKNLKFFSSRNEPTHQGATLVSTSSANCIVKMIPDLPTSYAHLWGEIWELNIIGNIRDMPSKGLSPETDSPILMRFRHCKIPLVRNELWAAGRTIRKYKKKMGTGSGIVNLATPMMSAHGSSRPWCQER